MFPFEWWKASIPLPPLPPAIILYTLPPETYTHGSILGKCLSLYSYLTWCFFTDDSLCVTLHYLCMGVCKPLEKKNQSRLFELSAQLNTHVFCDYDNDQSRITEAPSLTPKRLPSRNAGLRAIYQVQWPRGRKRAFGWQFWLKKMRSAGIFIFKYTFSSTLFFKVFYLSYSPVFNKLKSTFRNTEVTYCPSDKHMNRLKKYKSSNL